MKHISIFVKGDRNSTAYYRIYQYFDKISGCCCSYYLIYPAYVQRCFMPIGTKPIIIKILVFVIAYFRVLLSLIKVSFIKIPDVVIIHKRLIPRYMPLSFKFLLKRLKNKNVHVVWDFDDHLIEGKEMSKKTFNYFSYIADTIVVTHDFLKSLLPDNTWPKVIIMPTTDGDMYKIPLKDVVFDERIKYMEDRIVLVWVATSGNLINLLTIMPELDKASKYLYNKLHKKLILKVVCDKPLVYSPSYLTIVNIKWTRQNAIHHMTNAHIGIMPLLDNEYNKGKGGFKLVQYLSIGLPCIGSNIGYNKLVIGDNCGFLAKDEGDWFNAIKTLSDVNIWKQYSFNAYNYWLEHFSFDRNMRKWADIIGTEA